MYACRVPSGPAECGPATLVPPRFPRALPSSLVRRTKETPKALDRRRRITTGHPVDPVEAARTRRARSPRPRSSRSTTTPSPTAPTWAAPGAIVPLISQPSPPAGPGTSSAPNSRPLRQRLGRGGRPRPARLTDLRRTVLHPPRRPTPHVHAGHEKRHRGQAAAPVRQSRPARPARPAHPSSHSKAARIASQERPTAHTSTAPSGSRRLYLSRFLSRARRERRTSLSAQFGAQANLVPSTPSSEGQHTVGQLP